MYTFELKQYIRDRWFILTREEMLYVTNLQLHPQINHIKLSNGGYTYEMWDDNGDYLHFDIKPYVKTLKK